MQDQMDKFIKAMQDAGCGPHNALKIVADDEWHNYRLEGDPARKERGYYQFKIEDNGFAVGRFGDRRMGETIKWHTKSNRKWTDEEKAAWKQKIDDDNKRKAEKEKIAQEDASKKAKDMFIASVDADPKHPYLKKKKIDPAGIKQDGDTLIIPMYANGKMWGIQTIDKKGDKLYMRGAKKKGCFYPIAGDKSAFIVAEGFATGVSINMATGSSVAVCFDAGNLVPVAVSLRQKYPDAKIVIAGDNDQWTFLGKKKPKDIKKEDYAGDDEMWDQWRDEGRLKNTGVDSAKQAATKSQGFSIVPNFPTNQKDKLTDFNDLHCSEGLEAVKDRILEAGAVPSLVEVAGGSSQYPGDGVQTSGDQIPLHAYNDDAMYEPIDGGEIVGDLGLPLRILGFNDGTYYYFPFGTEQIVGISTSGHSINSLLSMVSYNKLEDYVDPSGSSKPSSSAINMFCTNALMRKAEGKGVFKPADKVRGCGVWMDAGRTVMHCGDYLIVDGVKIELKQMMSGGYVYTKTNRLLNPADKELSNAEAYKLRKICELPSWRDPLSGLLLAGWLVAAPICAALEWRPHVWITGPSGAGKTTVVNQIVKKVMGAMSMNVEGGTTESGIRNLMGYDVRPVVFDEAEGDGSKKTNMDGVLSLARLSSSGGRTVKYGQDCQMRSSFCFSSINPPIKNFADETRISMMELVKVRNAQSQKNYEDMIASIEETLTPEYARMLLTRTINNLPVFLKNVKTFKKAATGVIKGAREADQISVMIAGLWLLSSTKEVTMEEATAWLEAKDWGEHTSINIQTDHEVLFEYLCASMIRVDLTSKAREIPIGTLISYAITPNDDLCPHIAGKTLNNYGIRVSQCKRRVFVANANKNLQAVLRNTKWGLKWNNTLKLLPGAIVEKNVQYFITGMPRSRCISLPSSLFVFDDEGEELEEELPLT